jgi:hypothetical protein
MYRFITVVIFWLDCGLIDFDRLFLCFGLVFLSQLKFVFLINKLLDSVISRLSFAVCLSCISQFFSTGGWSINIDHSFNDLIAMSFPLTLFDSSGVMSVYFVTLTEIPASGFDRYTNDSGSLPSPPVYFSIRV